MRRDAIELLEADHREVEALFAQVEGGGTGTDLVGQIVRSLAVHDAIERQYLYPLVRDKVPINGDRLAQVALEEHSELSLLLLEIEHKLDEGATGEGATGRALELLGQAMAAVRAHVREEEQAIFPQLRLVSTPQDLNELAEKLERAKAKAPTHPHPRSSASGAAARAVGMVAGAVDRARDKAGDA